MKKINVMHLRSVNGSGGGPEKTILLSGEVIDRKRFNMFIVYLKGADDKSFGVTEKARGLDINYIEIGENGKFDLAALTKIMRLIKRHKIDIVHTHGYKPDFYGWVLSKMCGIRLVATMHGWIGNNPKERFYNWLDKKVIRDYDRVITVCDMMRSYLLRKGLAFSRLSTIHNAIDTDDFKRCDSLKDLRAELNIANGTPVIGVIGRLSREKRLGLLFSMTKKIIAELGDVKLLVVGDGPLKQSLKLEVKGLRLEDNVLFLGQRYDMKSVYKTIDLLVSVSSTEGLPNNVLEALAMEVPVVVTNVGGVGEIVWNRVNGLVFAPDDIDGITMGIVDLLKERGMALDFSKEGRMRVCREFSFDARMRKMEEVYTEVMGAKNEDVD